jgi:hypothetical protein
MVVHDFNPGGRAVLPHEADPIPLVNPDAVLAGSVALEGLQMQAGTLEVVERTG